MGKVLYINASPRHGRSHSAAVAEAFVKSYAANNPGVEVIKHDLFSMELPAMDGLAVQAKYTIMHGERPTGEEKAAWAEIERVIGDFKAADKYVFAVPMWNFSIPYRLKQYLDVIIQPGYTFSFSPDEGYKGLAGGKPVFVAYARGGTYSPGTPGESMDYQSRYLETALGFMGFTDIESVVVEPTVQEGPDVAKAKREAAIKGAEQMAQEF
jgi:FMN-dependent NADH-azoreductase